MINYVDIENNLIIIDGKYNNPSTSTHEQILYSKLAVLEFCGWIEESLDQILKDYLSSRVTLPYQSYIENKVIKKVYGFDYEKYTRKMFCTTIGVKNLEDVEYVLNSYGGQISSLESLLSTYTTIRNDAAHNSTPTGTTITYNSPSIVLSDYRRIKLILSNLELALSSL